MIADACSLTFMAILVDYYLASLKTPEMNLDCVLVTALKSGTGRISDSETACYRVPILIEEGSWIPCRSFSVWGASLLQ